MRQALTATFAGQPLHLPAASTVVHSSLDGASVGAGPISRFGRSAAKAELAHSLRTVDLRNLDHDATRAQGHLRRPPAFKPPRSRSCYAQRRKEERQREAVKEREKISQEMVRKCQKGVVIALLFKRMDNPPGLDGSTAACSLLGRISRETDPASKGGTGRPQPASWVSG